ncbi:Claspin [Papilio machaon]|uniref:Claspin n=1 Tax=Papilio machaon TaxID=76193 RepID=A0A0N1INJ9_PAPMA|nr:Claspin [Papilio machaon]
MAGFKQYLEGKREVRLLQELLFEDGDLGDGHRQRKFRWKDADDTEETGAAGDEFADTQEEEFESEELWRKQRHEREMEDEDLNNSGLNRSALIKANLSKAPQTSQVTAPNKNFNEDKEKEVQEKKAHKDIPIPKKPFAIFQQNYHGSLLSRGKGTLARLAAIANPLAGDGETTKISTSTNRRNFVFAALSQDEEPKATKRKADIVAPSPVLIKKLKAEEKQKPTRSSLFDYLDG